ncbi:MAG: hypothetical protein SPH77_03580 [Campylobacter sp.]|uniref:hypothetical protein n=1 Tax=Campylobacter sp. TaxID=205 RepID=UPI002A843669|nr:hypothetical protein [Campylobacter sp.]MCI7237450.1 hypothetical protein [Campylobacter sp.]MDY4829490.1 hypothetical protein [Campylobacter sp.]MDY6187896.1 hypothetical protein [Campylobacter sp.]
MPKSKKSSLGILDFLGILEFISLRCPLGFAAAVKNRAPRFLSYFLCSQRSTSRGAVSAVAAGEISRLNFKDEVRRKLP